MDVKETQKIIASMCAFYPNFAPPNKEALILAWTDALEEYSYTEVSMALKIFNKTSNSGFAPSIAQLIDAIEKPKELAYMNEGEAWSLVRKAISRSVYYAQEEFEKLPSDVRKAVGSASQLQTWAMSEDYNESVIASNFQRAYRQVVERKKTMERLPVEVKQLISESDFIARLTDG